MNRTVIKVAGASGMGLLSVGTIISKALKGMGFYINSDREYPSLIKGGHSNVQIDFSVKPVRCLSAKVNLAVALDRAGLIESLEKSPEGTVLIHGFERHEMMRSLPERAQKKGITVLYLPARTMAYALGGSAVMVNMVLIGLLWRILGFDLKPLEDEIRQQFADKPKLLEIDLKCVRAGYEAKELKGANIPQFKVAVPKKVPQTIRVDGNNALAIGAVQCGVRAYYAYPMSPSSTILSHMAEYAKEYGLLVKQAEDEITAAEMALGSMFMGTRALVATSGGGYDLMTETVSLAGMIETPLVIIIAQRPGPATGLPTWTCQGDLNLAIHAAHGEFARIVIAVSDPTSCYEEIQHAMNLAEEYQTPVIVLTEKQIAETQVTVEPFRQKTIPVKRHLIVDPEELAELKPSDRFRLTENGVSKRWIPGSSRTHFFGNGDEHEEDGTLTEEAVPAAAMANKRMLKLTTIQKALPEPEIYGNKQAKISFVGWGSSKNVMLDVIQDRDDVNYLHFKYMWPLKTERAKQWFKENRNVHLIENNYQGQLGEMIEGAIGQKFKGRLLKYNGRAFYLEEVLEYVKLNS